MHECVEYRAVNLHAASNNAQSTVQCFVCFVDLAVSEAKKTVSIQ